jgi:hypothetical protein
MSTSVRFKHKGKDLAAMCLIYYFYFLQIYRETIRLHTNKPFLFFHSYTSTLFFFTVFIKVVHTIRPFFFLDSCITQADHAGDNVIYN